MQEQPTNPKSGMAGIGFIVLLGAAGFLVFRVLAAITGGGC